MKHRVLTIIGTILVSLLVVSMAYAYAATSVDGVWGYIDTNGATGERWATGDGDSPTYTIDAYWLRNYTQNRVLLDENQVRYGDTNFANQSGFGFDGNNNVGAVAVDTPFLLGEFTHYNNPITSSNSFDYVNLAASLSGIQCLEGGTPTEGSTFSFTYRFDLDETPNSGTCLYPGTSICPDRVTVSSNPSTAKFTCPEGEYTVQVLGFAPSPTNQNEGCFQSGLTLTTPTSGYFITEERADNYACLWAKITDYVPTAVDLADFTATDQINAVLVNWSSASELNIAGYNLFRSTNPEDAGVQINGDVILAKNPGLFDGASYEFIDNSAVFGQTYYYTLQVIYSDNEIQWSDQVPASTTVFKISAPSHHKALALYQV